MKKYLLIVLLFVFRGVIHAQHPHFVNSGEITFERKINTFAVMSIFLKETKASDDQITTFINQYRSNSPQFKTDSFKLYFDKKNSLYKPINPELGISKTFAIPVAYKNLVFSNFETKAAYTEKQAFEKPFFIKDSVKTVKWKITDETKEIAGYECRRANGLLFDSIYVVAFYTTEIPLESGPESFNGLPGMILGVAVPHKHVSIFAKSVTGFDTSPDKWNLPAISNNSLMNNKEFIVTAEKLLKNSGRFFPWIQFFINL